MLQSGTFSVLVGSAAAGVTPPITKSSTPQSAAFTQPTLNFDFTSMMDRTSAANAMNAARSNWGSFFTQRLKPTFTQ